jgi:hypothetical protein
MRRTRNKAKGRERCPASYPLITSGAATNPFAQQMRVSRYIQHTAQG